MEETKVVPTKGTNPHINQLAGLCFNAVNDVLDRVELIASVESLGIHSRIGSITLAPVHDKTGNLQTVIARTTVKFVVFGDGREKHG